ncbi:MAG: hypothetical protein MZU91_12270 [Desulfosudis oleivorans]|nr:hypothetical protein [Desulfosudis oleivorans]
MHSLQRAEKPDCQGAGGVGGEVSARTGQRGHRRGDDALAVEQRAGGLRCCGLCCTEAMKVETKDFG